ncbi:MAG: hypothetical protein RIC95_11440 [Vicingaceae bacterium]
MENLFNRKVLYFLIILLSIACSKNEVKSFGEAIESESNKQKKINSKNNSPELTVDENGVLFFENIEEMQNFISWAESEIESYDQSFLAEYGHLSGDTLADSLFVAGYNSDQPLINFEENFSDYNSLRKKVSEDMIPILQQEDFDYASSPDAQYIGDPIMRTILNEDGAYGLGDSIYFPLDSGYLAIGPEANYDLAVEDINNDDMPMGSLSGPFRKIVIILPPPPPGGGGGGGSGLNCANECRTNRLNAKDVTDGNKKMALTLSLMYSGAGTHLAMKVVSYKRLTSWSSWFRYPYSKFAGYNTTTYYTGSNCNNAGTLPGESKNNSSLLRCTVRHTFWGGAARRVKCNTLYGSGSMSGINQTSLTIAWS